MSMSFTGPSERGADLSKNIAVNLPWIEPGADGNGFQCEGGAPALRFVAESEIYCDGEEAKAYYKIVSGAVRTCKFLSDGRRQIDAFYLPGDIFGVEAGCEHRLSAEAVTDCVLRSYRRSGLEIRAATDERLAHQLFSHTMRSLERAQNHSMLLCRRMAAEKLASFLLEIADRQNAQGLVDLPMTRQDMADYLGLTIETVSRTLSQFERDNLIAMPTARRIVFKDHRALEDLCD